MNWILFGVAAVVLGPPLLRKMAENPDALNRAADAGYRVRGKIAEGGRYAARATRDAYNRYRNRSRSIDGWMD